jgi:hypothetical protein
MRWRRSNSRRNQHIERVAWVTAMGLVDRPGGIDEQVLFSHIAGPLPPTEQKIAVEAVANPYTCFQELNLTDAVR